MDLANIFDAKNGAADKGWTPLHLAIIYNSNADVLKYLISQKADVNAKGQADLTPLHVAAFKGSLEAAKILVSASADINAESDEGLTPLHVAAMRGHVEIAKVFISAGAFNVKDKYDRTPLSMARLERNTAMMECLSSLAGFANIFDAIEKGTVRDVLNFIKAKPADANARNSNGDSPLHISIRHGKFEIAKFLISNGADVNAKNDNGFTPLIEHEERSKLRADKPKGEFGAFTDIRDGKVYKTVKIGSQIWMAQNLNYNAIGSKYYDNDQASYEKYGRLYDWSTALKICPPGWHLPSNAEWDDLYRYVDGSSGAAEGSLYDSKTAGRYLKAGSGWNGSGNGTDDYGFAALPGGRGYSGRLYFNRVGGTGYYWTSSSHNEYDAYYRYMDYRREGAYWSSYNKTSLRSVRCIQD